LPQFDDNSEMGSYKEEISGALQQNNENIKHLKVIIQNSRNKKLGRIRRIS